MKKVLYAVSEAQPGIRGEIAAFHCTDKGLTLINKVLAPGAGLVHAALDPEEKLLFAVSYRDASILMYELREDGGIGELLDEKIHTGQGRDPVRQEKAHAHSVWFTPDGKRICVCDLGIDRLVVYEVNYSCMKLEEKKNWASHFHRDQGRDIWSFIQMAVLPMSWQNFLLRFLSWTIIQNQALRLLVKENSLCRYEGYSIGAAIRISGDGKYLYSSNRGADDIAVYRISDEGQIKRLLIYPVKENIRDFILASRDRYLLCANRDTDNITVYLRDSETGRFSYLRK